MDKDNWVSCEDDRISTCRPEANSIACSFHGPKAEIVDDKLRLLYSIIPLHRYCMWCGKDSQDATSDKPTI